MLTADCSEEFLKKNVLITDPRYDKYLKRREELKSKKEDSKK
tara:strand:- start:11978 stop:12103 length:126 start_codon:yes stop_codon:yes gene_type:complete